MDLISFEYKWSDDVILDLPLCRIRQIMANIHLRKKEDFKIQASVAEWQTKVLASFIVSSGMADEDGRTQLHDAIRELSLTSNGEPSLKTLYKEIGVSEEDMGLDPQDPEFIFKYGNIQAYRNAEKNVRNNEKIKSNVRGFSITNME